MLSSVYDGTDMLHVMMLYSVWPINSQPVLPVCLWVWLFTGPHRATPGRTGPHRARTGPEMTNYFTLTRN